MSLSNCRNARERGGIGLRWRPAAVAGRTKGLIGGAVLRLRNSKVISLGQVTECKPYRFDSTRIRCRRAELSPPALGVVWGELSCAEVSQLAGWLAGRAGERRAKKLTTGRNGRSLL